jgi:hypothetical protein
MNRNLFRNNENILYRNSYRDMNMLDTKRLDYEFYNQTMKNIKKPEVRLEQVKVVKNTKAPIIVEKYLSSNI